MNGAVALRADGLSSFKQPTGPLQRESLNGCVPKQRAHNRELSF